MHRERIGELGGRASGDGVNSNAGASGNRVGRSGSRMKVQASLMEVDSVAEPFPVAVPAGTLLQRTRSTTPVLHQ